MKKLVLIFIAIFYTLIIYAQPTISSDWIPKIGDNWTSLIKQDSIDVGEEGADIVWDFSDLNYESFIYSSTFDWIDPSGTEYFSLFESSNLCAHTSIEGLGSVNSYYAVGPESMDLLGSGAVNNRTLYSDPLSLAYFDLQYQDTLIDIYHFNQYFSENVDSRFFNGQSVWIYDAYGTLILPHTTIHDVIRIRQLSDDVFKDSNVNSLYEEFTKTVSYLWIAPGSVFPVFQYERSQILTVVSANGVTLVEEYSDAKHAMSVNTEYTTSTTDFVEQPELDLYPTITDSKIQILNDIKDKSQYRIINLFGELMLSGTLQNGRNEIDVSSLLSGQYIVHLPGRQSKRFLKISLF